MANSVSNRLSWLIQWAHMKHLMIPLISLNLCFCTNTNISDKNMAIKACECKCPSEHRVGGFKTAKIDDSAIKATELAIHSMDTQYRLKEIRQVKTQVVAGMNYWVVFSLSDGSQWQATVFKDLNNKYKVIESPKLWPVKDCNCR